MSHRCFLLAISSQKVDAKLETKFTSPFRVLVMSKVTGGKRKSPSKNVKKTVKKKKIDTPKNQHYNDEQDSMWEVECIVDKTYDDSDKLFYKVHWRGWPDEMDTWELAENLSGCKDLIKKFEKDKRNTGLYSVEKILGKRTNNNGTTEYRVKWLGYSEHSSTWEPEENILDKKLIENFDNEKEVDAIDMLYDADLVQLYSHKEYFLGIYSITKSTNQISVINIINRTSRNSRYNKRIAILITMGYYSSFTTIWNNRMGYFSTRRRRTSSKMQNNQRHNKINEKNYSKSKSSNRNG